MPTETLTKLTIDRNKPSFFFSISLPFLEVGWAIKAKSGFAAFCFD
jgi:hypothetical protein